MVTITVLVSMGCFFLRMVRLSWGCPEDMSLNSLDSQLSLLVWRGWGVGDNFIQSLPSLNTPPPLLLGFSRISSTVVAHSLLTLYEEKGLTVPGTTNGCLPSPPLFAILCPSILTTGGPAHLISKPCTLRPGYGGLKLSPVLCFLTD